MRFEKRSITSWLVRILILLKLLPTGRSKLEDWCGFLFWMMSQISLTGLWFYQMGAGLAVQMANNLSMAGIMKLLSSFLAPAFHNIGIVWILTKPKHKTSFIYSRYLKAPASIPILLAIAALQGISIYSLFKIGVYQMIGSVISLAILSFLSVFVIGVFVSQSSLDNQIELLDIRSAIQVAQLEISNLRDLKNFLSPLLFVVLASNGSIALANSYGLFTNRGPNPGHILLVLLGFFVSASLIIIYTCVTVNKCCLRYNALILTLRYIQLDYFMLSS